MSCEIQGLTLPAGCANSTRVQVQDGKDCRSFLFSENNAECLICPGLNDAFGNTGFLRLLNSRPASYSYVGRSAECRGYRSVELSNVRYSVEFTWASTVVPTEDDGGSATDAEVNAGLSGACAMTVSGRNLYGTGGDGEPAAGGGTEDTTQVEQPATAPTTAPAREATRPAAPNGSHLRCSNRWGWLFVALIVTLML